MPPPDVLGVSEIAALLGVSRQRVLELDRKGQLPEPTVLKGGKIWDRQDVLAWMKATGREAK